MGAFQLLKKHRIPVHILFRCDKTAVSLKLKQTKPMYNHMHVDNEIFWFRSTDYMDTREHGWKTVE